MLPIVMAVMTLPTQGAAAMPRTPRIAVVYSDFRVGEKNMLASANEDLHWEIDSWNVKDMDGMEACIEQYDMIVFGACYNFTPGFELKPDGTCRHMLRASVLRRFVEDGGVILHCGAGDDRAGDAWFRSIDPGLSYEFGKCGFEEDSDWYNEETPLQVGPRRTGWCHFVKMGPAWTEMNRCCHGKTIMAWAQVGKGFVLASAHVTTTGVTHNAKAGGSTLSTYWAHAHGMLFSKDTIRIDAITLPGHTGAADGVVSLTNKGTQAEEVVLSLYGDLAQHQTASHRLSVEPGGSVEQELRCGLVNEGKHLITVDVEDVGGRLLDRQRTSIRVPEAERMLTDIWRRAERHLDTLAEIARGAPRVLTSKPVLEKAYEYGRRGIRTLPAEATLATLKGIEEDAADELADLQAVEDRLEVWAQLVEPRGDRFAVAGLHMSDKLDRDDIRLRGQLERVSVHGCRDEYVCAQIAVVPLHSRLRTVNVTVSDLACAGETIPASASRARPIQFLHSWEDDWYAELVRNKQEFAVGADEAARSVWITTHVPDDAAPGVYRGTITVDSPHETQTFPMRLKVWNFDMPHIKHLPTDFSFRPNQVYGLFASQHWHEQGWREMVTREQYERLSRWIGEYRINPTPYDESRNPIDGYGPHQTSQPWLHAEWEGDELVIDWEGFDWTVELLRSMGYRTFRAGYMAGVVWDPDETTESANAEHYEAKGKFWRAFLPRVEAHIAENDWSDTTFYWYQKDEVQKHLYHQFANVATELKELAPSVKRLTVLQTPLPEALNAYTDIWIPSFGALSLNMGAMPKLKSEGDWVGAYVCTSPAPPFSELMMHEPGLNHRLLPWICRQAEIDLLLYYGLNFWMYQWRPFETNVDQIDDDGHLYDSWPRMGGGGGVLFYPGGKTIDDEPQPSLRLELLRQGMQDYEYFWLLDDLTKDREDDIAREARKLLDIPDVIVPGLTGFTENETLVDSYKARLGQAIETLMGD